jgi:transcriptional regulator with XRE-family HTH domain
LGVVLSPGGSRERLRAVAAETLSVDLRVGVVKRLVGLVVVWGGSFAHSVSLVNIYSDAPDERWIGQMMNREFIARLNTAFQHASMADVARQLGVPHATVRNYYLGRLPSPDVLIKIAKETGVSLNWLLMGTGEIYISDAPRLGLGPMIERRIEEIVDRRLNERLGRAFGHPNEGERVFDVASAIERLGDPQSVMGEWFRFEGREYPSDYGVVFFKGWEAFSSEERVAAVRDAKRVLDRSLSEIDQSDSP